MFSAHRSTDKLSETMCGKNFEIEPCSMSSGYAFSYLSFESTKPNKKINRSIGDFSNKKKYIFYMKKWFIYLKKEHF